MVRIVRIYDEQDIGEAQVEGFYDKKKEIELKTRE